MEPFIVDYAMQRGHEMLITRDPPFKRNEMDEIDLHMLQAETIPRLLRVDWLEVDGSLQFRYSLTGKRMLAQRLSAQPIGMSDYYELLLGVIEALDECRHYLLRENCCLLDERYLYVGERWSDVWLTYVPLREGCAKQSYQEALLALAARWGARVTDVEGGGLQMVLKLLEAPGSTLSGIRNALLEWMGRPEAAGSARAPAAHDGIRISGSSNAGILSTPDAGIGAVRSNAAGARPNGRRGFDSAIMTNPLAHKAGKADHAARSVEVEYGGAGAAGRGQSHAGEAGQAELTGYLDREWRTEQGKQADASRAKWLSGALTLVVCACCWRFVYLPSPGMGPLLICIGLTMLMLWGMVTLWSKLGRNRAALAILPIDDAMPEEDSGNMFQGIDSVVNREEQIESLDQRRPAGIGYSSGGWAAESAPSAASDETTLLSDAAPSGKRPEGAVMREYQGQSLRIVLPIGISVIGRAAEISHILDSADGVSRTHLELEWDGQQVKARDLASRNGSLMNGAPMVPYKLYELQRTDWVQLAGTEGPRYTLHVTD